VLASIGSVGDAYDNATAESFVDTLKTELVADRVFATRRQLEHALVEWVPGTTSSASMAASATSHPPSTSRRNRARRMTSGSHQTQFP
jgi:transposase InsO family protein